MHPIPVFSSLRPARHACGLLAAAALILPTAGSAQTSLPMGPGNPVVDFTPTKVAATIYSILYEKNPDTSSTSLGDLLFVAGDDGVLETDLQATTGIAIPNLPVPLYGSGGRIVFTAAQERPLNPSAPVTALPKILLGGLFGQSDYQLFFKEPAQNIVRIFADGTQDNSFIAGLNANNYITSILPLTNQKIMVGGLFTAYNGEPRLRIVRLNNDGTIDETFSAASFIDNDVLALAEGIMPFSSYPGGTPRPDGTILVAGLFNHVGGLPIAKLARLNADGSVDTTFHPVIDERVNAIAVQPSGKIIIGGQFTNINGTPVSRIARLNRDGSLDTTFTTTVSGERAGETAPVAVYVLTQLSSKGGFDLFVGGNFTLINGQPRQYLGLLDPNGTLQSFNPDPVLYDKVQSIAVAPDGKVLVGETLGPKIGSTYIATFVELYGATHTN